MIEEENELFNYKFETFDISCNSWGSPACANDRRRRMQEVVGDGECPFTVIDKDFGDNPCDYCDFSDIDDFCLSEITFHCTFNGAEEGDVCRDFLEYLPNGCFR